MKLYEYIKHVSLSLVLVTVAGSCDKDFEEVNTNPNGPITIPATRLIPSIVERSADVMYNIFVGGDLGNCWAQMWGKVCCTEEARYQTRGDVINFYWNTFYAGTLTDAVEMEKLAIQEGSFNLQGVALIMQAHSFLMLTDFFGDVPFSEAIRASEGINNPKYDPQDAIYAGVIQLLIDADDLLATDDGTINAASDILYGGNVAGWRMFANSLHFRTLMRMSSVSGVSVGSQLQALVNAGYMFGSSDDEAKLIYLSAGSNVNPSYDLVVAGFRDEYRVGEETVTYLDRDGDNDYTAGVDDPRLPVYAQPTTDASLGTYRGKAAGYEDAPDNTWNYQNTSAIGALFLQPESPAYFMSYTELMFLMAEAAERGLISGGASDFFDTAIASSMAENGVINDIGIIYSGGLTQIHTEKWIALFGQGLEAWTEWRRTGIPALSPAVDAIGINEIPSRWTYPSSEQFLNNANYTAAVAIQGPDKLTTKIWWNK